LSEIEGIESTEESRLSKFQDIKYKIFTPYSQDNSKGVTWLRKGAKKPKNGLTNTKGLSIMAQK
jgi:hypothetical protein